MTNSRAEISSPRRLLQPIGVDQYSCRGIYIVRRAQARQPNLPLHTPDVNLAGAFVHNPSGERCSVAVLPGGSSIAIDALAHRDEISTNQERRCREGASGNDGRRGCRPVNGAPPQQLQYEREPQRLAASLAETGAQQPARRRLSLL